MEQVPFEQRYSPCHAEPCDRVNAGYRIVDSIHIGTVELVLGVSSTEPEMFVTWECTGVNNYFWGHYTPDLIAAKKDLLERAMQELEIMERLQGRQTERLTKAEQER